MRLFALGDSQRFGGSVAAALGCRLDPHEDRDFEDGEHKARPLEMIRRAEPLPEIPPELGVGTLEFSVPVSFALR